MRVFLTIGLLAFLTVAGAGQETVPQGDKRPAAELVRDLGSPRFAARAAAEKALLQLGPKARAALRAGLKSPHAEVKIRCARLLARLDEKEWQGKLDAYVADFEGKRAHDLPLREAYEKRAGTSASARKLFVACLRKNGTLLRQAAADRTRGLAAYRARCRALVRAEGGKGAPRLPAPDLAILLLLDVALKAGAADWKDQAHVAHLFANPGLRAAAADRETGAAFRKLLVAWARAKGTDADLVSQQLFLYFIDAANFKEGLGVVWDWARDKKGYKGHFRPVAVAILGKVGGKGAAADLEKLWGNGEVLFAAPDKAEGDARLGDQALAASMRLAGKAPQDYGLIEIPLLLKGPADRSWRASAYRFDSDDARRAALKKWRADAGPRK